MPAQPDERSQPEEPLLQSLRSDLARIEAAQRAASDADSDHLYERLLRYRRIIAMLENRTRITRAEGGWSIAS